MRTKQEIFDIVGPGLLTQGIRSEIYREGGGLPVCAYRGPEGRKCAAGMIMPDEVYSADFENETVKNLPEYVLIGMGIYETGAAPVREHETIRFVARFQNLHDNYRPEDWAEGLKGIASDNTLSTESIKAWLK